MHPRVAPGDVVVAAIAAAVALAIVAREPRIAVLLAIAAVAVLRPRRIAFVAAALIVAGGVRGPAAWDALDEVQLGPFVGAVRVVDDPQPYRSATRVVVEAEGERFEVWARRTSMQRRTDGWRAGDLVEVAGERVELRSDRRQRVAWQHVVGELRLDWAGDARAGSALARSSNRVRALIETASDAIEPPWGALYRGLVIGDDRDQPRDMIERFRATGLSHLTAVSGQNVAFVLAACGLLLRRLPPWPRWIATITVIAWFVVLTRFEPSILRAGVMAGLSATAFVTGRERTSTRLLGLAVIALLLIDPLLAWSVGFWLSVGATAGVCVVGPWLERRMSQFGLLATPLAITLGAQVGVLLPSVLVFGRLPLVSVPANLFAGPVAGAVMLVGLPVGIVAGAVPAIAPVLMAPIGAATAWVDGVSIIAIRLEPPAPWPWIGWVAIGAAIAAIAVRR